MDTDLKAMHNHLDNNPPDWETRLVLADYYEQEGD